MTKPYLDSPPLPASALAIEADQDAALAAVGPGPEPALAAAGARSDGPGLPHGLAAGFADASAHKSPYRSTGAVPMPASSPYLLLGIDPAQPHETRPDTDRSHAHDPNPPRVHDLLTHDPHRFREPRHPRHPHVPVAPHVPHVPIGHGVGEDGGRPWKQRAAHRHGRGDGGSEPVHEQVAEVGPGLLGADVAPGPGEDTATWLRRVGAL